MKFKQIYSTNIEYDLEQIQKRKELYKSIDMCKPDVARMFIRPLPGEDRQVYNAKLNFTQYDPMLKSIVNSYVSTLFAPQLSVITSDSYQDIVKDCDGKKTEIQNFLSESIKTAEYLSTAYIGVDLSVQKKFKNLAEQKRSKSHNPYVYHIDPEHVIDWQVDDLDQFQWIKLYDITENPRSPEDQNKYLLHTISVWKLEDDKVILTKYKYIQKNKGQFNKSQEADEIVSFELPIQQIPIIKIDLCGTSVIDTIQALLERYFLDQTNYNYAVYKAGYPVPYLAAGNEYENEVINSIQSDEDRIDTAQSEFAKKGFMVIGKDDKLNFLQPDVASYKLMQDDLKTLKDVIYHSVSLLAQSLSASTLGQARSAASKQADNNAFNQNLEQLGRITMDATTKIFALMSDLLNEDIEVEVSGLSSYNNQDRELLIDEAVGALSIDIPSDTFKAKYLAQTAVALINNLDPITEKLIVKEITEASEHIHDEPADKSADELTNETI